MAIIESKYKSPFYFRNGHIATVLPSMFREVKGVDYERERVDTLDGDFLDFDWVKNGHRRVALLFHGLEGSSDRHYVKGVARVFADDNWDVLAVNFRSCSGEMNKTPRFYHHADKEEVKFIIDHVLAGNDYDSVALVGFSMGGAMILNYLGDASDNVPKEISAAVAFSSPVDVGGSARELEKPGRAFYLNRFLDKLKTKIKLKSKDHPEVINTEGLDDIKTFLDYDNRYTAPLHGFENAADFYHNASSYYKISGIKVPTLLVTAANDPFMSGSCYPYEEARDHTYFDLEVPMYGGHVGFPLSNFNNSWMEIRALEYVKMQMGSDNGK